MNSIAYNYGFFWQTLWDLPQNAELKRTRKDPNVLLKGDKVFVPEKRLHTEECQTDQSFRFRLKGVPARFDMRFLNDQDQPRIGLKYQLDINGAQFSGVTDDQGTLSVFIPPNAKNGKLTLYDGTAVEEYALNLGHLNPSDVKLGAHQMLANLGWLDEKDPDPELAYQQALRLFQNTQGLEPSGELDPTTSEALSAAYHFATG